VAAVTVEGLGKCYRLGKQRLGAMEGLGQLLAILNLGSKRKELTRDLWALSDVSFSVEPGEVLGIIGRNGAGKSTLLKILARITLPTTGRATIRGRVVSLLELGAGFHPELTGRENIYLNAAFYGIGKDEVTRHMDEIVAFAELEQFIDTPVRHYSSGMYVRLAFSNAIHMRPDVLLADEVLAVGDIHFQNRCMNKMQEISRSGITVLFVSHDMESIRRLCHRCIRLDHGQILDDGDSVSVVERYLTAVIGGFPQTSTGALVPTAATSQSCLNSFAGSIVAVRLLSPDGDEVSTLNVRREQYLALTFRIIAEQAKVFGSFDVLCDNKIVLRTYPQTIYEIDAPGVYELRVRLPKDFFTDVVYDINAGLRILLPDGKDSKLNFIKALSVRGYDIHKENLISGVISVRPVGVVSPNLDWHMMDVTLPAVNVK